MDNDWQEWRFPQSVSPKKTELAGILEYREKIKSRNLSKQIC